MHKSPNCMDKMISYSCGEKNWNLETTELNLMLNQIKKNRSFTKKMKILQLIHKCDPSEVFSMLSK